VGRGRYASAAQRDAIYQQIMERGWNSKVGAFTQHYDTDVLDSALLKMPLEGFIAPDGLAGDEGTFTLCTFWYVDALAQAGRLGDARLGLSRP
jgi:GH15 family glucan-1,4-alpha-glucosidase